MSLQPTQGFGFSRVLEDAWNTGLGSFEKWVDSEIGAEGALATETATQAAALEARQAPESPSVLGVSPGVLMLGAAAGLLAILMFTGR